MYMFPGYQHAQMKAWWDLGYYTTFDWPAYNWWGTLASSAGLSNRIIKMNNAVVQLQTALKNSGLKLELDMHYAVYVPRCKQRLCEVISEQPAPLHYGHIIKHFVRMLA